MPRRRTRTLAIILILASVAASSIAIAVYYAYYREDRNAPAVYFRSVGTIAGKGREFGEPFGIAVRNGDIFVSDGDTGRILKIDPAGSVSVVAEGLNTPSAIVFDSTGDLIVAD